MYYKRVSYNDFMVVVVVVVVCISCVAKDQALDSSAISRVKLG